MFTDGVSNSLSQSDMFTALRTFLLSVVSMPVIQSQQNRVSLPTGNFIAMTSLGMEGKSTNTVTYSDQSSTPGSEKHYRTTLWRAQVDVYGSEAGQIANALAVAFRSEWGCEAFAASGFPVTPAYTDEPRNTAFIDSESQYEDRWTMTMVMVIDNSVTLPRYFFDSANVEAYSVDEYALKNS